MIEVSATPCVKGLVMTMKTALLILPDPIPQFCSPNDRVSSPHRFRKGVPIPTHCIIRIHHVNCSFGIRDRGIIFMEEEEKKSESGKYGEDDVPQ
jgi:hypothetical protein